MPDIPDLSIFFLTVGENVAFESLEALKAHTKQPYRLTIWYDTCGRGIDWKFYEKLFSYSQDVVLLTQNHGSSGAWAYALLYLGGKYVMTVNADTVVQEGYLDRFYYAFSHFDKVACAGCFRVKSEIDFLVNSKEYMPDGVLMFSREAINELGGICAEFKGMGQEIREWTHRALTKGWNLITCAGIMKEIGTWHDGRNMNPNIQAEISESEKVYLGLMDSQWKDSRWWAQKRETKI